MLRLEIGVTQSTSTSAPRTCPALPVQAADCTLQTLCPPKLLKEYPDHGTTQSGGVCGQVFLQAHADVASPTQLDWSNHNKEAGAGLWTIPAPCCLAGQRGHGYHGLCCTRCGETWTREGYTDSAQVMFQGSWIMEARPPCKLLRTKDRGTHPSAIVHDLTSARIKSVLSVPFRVRHDSDVQFRLDLFPLLLRISPYPRSRPTSALEERGLGLVSCLGRFIKPRRIIFQLSRNLDAIAMQPGKAQAPGGRLARPPPSGQWWTECLHNLVCPLTSHVPFAGPPQRYRDTTEMLLADARRRQRSWDSPISHKRSLDMDPPLVTCQGDVGVQAKRPPVRLRQNCFVSFYSHACSHWCAARCATAPCT
jgi:hypothetical protein